MFGGSDIFFEGVFFSLRLKRDLSSRRLFFPLHFIFTVSYITGGIDYSVRGL